MKVITNKDLKKQYKLKVVNKMRWFGDTDIHKKIIRVNKKMSKKSGKTGEVLDTIVHEAMHAKHPKRLEKTIRRKTQEAIAHMNRLQKSRYYKMFT